MRSLRKVSESDRAGDSIDQLGHKSGSYDLILPSCELRHLKAISLEASRGLKVLVNVVSEKFDVATTGGCR